MAFKNQLPANLHSFFLTCENRGSSFYFLSPVRPSSHVVALSILPVGRLACVFWVTEPWTSGAGAVHSCRRHLIFLPGFPSAAGLLCATTQVMPPPRLPGSPDVKEKG
ncbi:hypothetical protein XENOCAPTIV_009720 [Xenoophorus captivus]|uniref:Uncharacterized protein n=1 Tax=Xenoophorus captivus TaxID=1517983 RepID=A0ABV0S617_9TELE